MWNPVVPDQYIYADMKTSYLHLKTSSLAGSRDVTVLEFSDEGNFAGGIGIGFYSPAEYRLLNCQANSSTFQTSLPAQHDNHWVIKKRGYRMILFCNGVQVLDITVSDETCDKLGYADTWVAYWSREANRFKFQPGDTASNLYYIGW